MEKVYCGNGKVRSSQYWEFYTLSLKLSELENYVNEKGYVSIVVNKRKTPDNYGNDLAVTINDYKSQEWQKQSVKTQKNEFWDVLLDDLPF